LLELSVRPNFFLKAPAKVPRTVCGCQANPGLAARAQPFVSGVVILLPDLAPARTDVINLWD